MNKQNHYHDPNDFNPIRKNEIVNGHYLRVVGQSVIIYNQKNLNKAVWETYEIEDARNWAKTNGD